MPFTEAGRPVDIVLNPLGVPSRMNIGQILEIHLGWGALELGAQIEQMVQDKREADEVRKFIKSVYKGDQEAEALIDSLSDVDVRRFAAKCRDGIFMGTPVFDGAEEGAILDTLSLAGLPRTGQAVLFDGRTGEAFDTDVTIGIMYMLKLHH